MKIGYLLHFISPIRLKHTLFWQVLLSILLTNCTLINNGMPAPEDLILVCADFSYPNQVELKTGGIFTLDVNDIGSLTQLAETPALYGFRNFTLANSFSPDRTHLAYVDGNTIKIIGFQDNSEIITTKYNPMHGILMYWSNDSRTYKVPNGNTTMDVLGNPISVPTHKYIDARTGAESTADKVAEEFEVYSPGKSPDGKYYVKSNNGNIQILEQETETVVFEIQSTVEYGEFDFIAWSPDSKQLLIWIREQTTTESNTTTPNDSAFDWQEFNSNFRTPHFARATLFTVNIDGTQLTQLTARGEVEPDIFPKWSPDGSRIIYGSWLSDTDGNGLAETERTYTSLILFDLARNVSREVLSDSYDVTCVDW